MKRIINSGNPQQTENSLLKTKNNKRKAENELFQVSPGIYILTGLGGGNQFQQS